MRKYKFVYDFKKLFAIILLHNIIHNEGVNINEQKKKKIGLKNIKDSLLYVIVYWNEKALQNQVIHILKLYTYYIHYLHNFNLFI